jgi:hypothetical protein
LYNFCTHPERDEFPRKHLPEDHPRQIYKNDSTDNK